MCVNDVICCGAKPLFFLDYIACGKNVPEKIAAIVAGVAEGCVQAGCALVGGETAEMPGFYPVNEYDLAGFSVGVVDRAKILDKTAMDLRINPNGSVLAVEAITSPDGRVLGKMAHTERSGRNLYRNVEGLTFQPLFEGGVAYFQPTRAR